MKCSSCTKRYDGKRHIPRLLVKCGHSSCELCLIAYFTSGSVSCPVCKKKSFAETIEDFPRNLALLDIHKPADLIQPSSDLKRRREKLESSLSLNRGILNPLSTATCPKHSKKFEAFCEKEKALICIDCILEDNHRDHSMISLDKACDKELETAKNHYEIAGNLEEKLEAIKDEVSDFIRVLRLGRKANEDSIKEFYGRIIDHVKKREIEVQNQMKKEFNKEETKANELIEGYNTQLEKLRDLMHNIESFTEVSSIDMLKQAASRHEIISQFAIEPKKFTRKKPPVTLTLETELRKLMSVLVPGKDKKVVNSTREIGSSPKLGSTNFIKPAGPRKPTVVPKNRNTLPSEPRKITPASFTSQKAGVYTVSKVISPNKTIQKTPKRPKKGKKTKKKQVGQSEEMEEVQVQFEDPFTLIHLKNEKVSVLSDTLPPGHSTLNISNISTITQSSISHIPNLVLKSHKILVLGGIGSGGVIAYLVDEERWAEHEETSRLGLGEMHQIPEGFCAYFCKDRVVFAQVRQSSGTVSADEYVFIVGGKKNEGGISAQVECRNLENGDSVHLPEMMITREDLAVEIDQLGRLYAIGGFGGYLKTCLSSIERFDPKSNTWQMLTEMSTPRRAPSCAIIQNFLYVIGGHDGARYLNSAEMYNISSGTWAKLPSMFEERCKFSVIKDTHNSNIYVFGGNEALSSAEKFNILENKWSKIAPMPHKCYSHCSILIES